MSKLNLVVIQAKEGDGFSPTAVGKMIFFVDDLLDLGKPEEKYHAVYNTRVIEAMKIFKQKYQLVIGECPEFGLEVLYICKQDVEPNEDCTRAADKLKDTVKRHFGAARCDFLFVNAPRLWAQVQLRPRKNKALQWATQPLETPEGFVGLVKLNDYFDFLKDDHGELQERIFESNVRGFWPNTPVNAGIKKTLESPGQADFWLLNNGVTILAATSSPAGTYKLLIDDPQIVNGLQTSRQVFNYYSALPAVPHDEKRRVLVRVIHAPDKSVRDDVIRATNSQNKMPDEALRATDPIHRQIEALFQQFGLFYDRRKGQCKDEGKPIAQIVSVLELLQAMLAIVLKRPDEARARPRNYIKDERLYTSVFGQDAFQLPVYLKAALLQRRVDDFIDNVRLGSGERMSYFHQRNIKFYMSMYAACAATKDPYAPPGSILGLEPSAIGDSLLQDCWIRVVDYHYTKLTEHEYPDAIAKGPTFLKAINTDLRRRFAKRKPRQKTAVGQIVAYE